MNDINHALPLSTSTSKIAVVGPLAVCVLIAGLRRDPPRCRSLVGSGLPARDAGCVANPTVATSETAPASASATAG